MLSLLVLPLNKFPKTGTFPKPGVWLLVLNTLFFLIPPITTISPSEALEKLQKGMRILIREGSVSKDLKSLHALINDYTSPYICLCTDDRNPLDIEEYGHIDFMIRTLIKMGVSPLNAYRSASLSASEAFGLNDRGIIAPGKKADIVILDN